MSSPINDPSKKQMVAYYSLASRERPVAKDFKGLKCFRKGLYLSAAGLACVTTGVWLSAGILRSSIPEDQWLKLMYLALGLMSVVLVLLAGSTLTTCKIISKEQKANKKEKNSLARLFSRNWLNPKSLSDMSENKRLIEDMKESIV